MLSTVSFSLLHLLSPEQPSLWVGEGALEPSGPTWLGFGPFLSVPRFGRIMLPSLALVADELEGKAGSKIGAKVISHGGYVALAMPLEASSPTCYG